jgi:hypothetical protein
LKGGEGVCEEGERGIGEEGMEIRERRKGKRRGWERRRERDRGLGRKERGKKREGYDFKVFEILHSNTLATPLRVGKGKGTRVNF